MALPLGRVRDRSLPLTGSGVESVPANVPSLPTKCPPNVTPVWVVNDGAVSRTSWNT